MKIIDNFLEKEQFEKIQQTMMGVDFPWYYQKNSNYKKDGLSQLTHGFYNYELSKRANSPFLEILTPILKKLDAVGLIRIKANLTYPAKVFKNDISPGFKNSLALKDLRLAIEHAKNEGLDLKTGKTVEKIYTNAIDLDYGNFDWTSMYKFIKENSNFD